MAKISKNKNSFVLELDRFQVHSFIEDGIYVAGSYQLDLFAQGDTKEESLQNFHKTFYDFLNYLIVNDTLEAVLYEAGFDLEIINGDVCKVIIKGREETVETINDNIELPLAQRN